MTIYCVNEVKKILDVVILSFCARKLMLGSATCFLILVGSYFPAHPGRSGYYDRVYS